MSLFIRGLATTMPDTIIDNGFFGDAVHSTKSPMFMGSKLRRHIQKDQSGSDLISQAVFKLAQEYSLDLQNDIDIVFTNVSVPDEPFSGCGAVVAKKAGIKAKWIYDIHNSGCIAFLYMLDLAESLLQAKDLRSALICTAQTAAGRVFSQPGIRLKAQAAIPGDGCAVAYVHREGNSKILGSVFKNFPEFSEDMYAHTEDGRKYWETGLSEGYINFDERNSFRILMRGNRIVPEMVNKICEKIGIKISEIDYLITNQPNLHFLRNWTEALQLRTEQHLHTFEKYANLFGAGIPVTLAEAVENRVIKPGNLLCLAGFAHACDYAGATLIRW